LSTAHHSKHSNSPAPLKRLCRRLKPIQCDPNLGPSSLNAPNLPTSPRGRDEGSSRSITEPASTAPCRTLRESGRCSEIGPGSLHRNCGHLTKFLPEGKLWGRTKRTGGCSLGEKILRPFAFWRKAGLGEFDKEPRLRDASERVYVGSRVQKEGKGVGPVYSDSRIRTARVRAN
jgi:hypothetical protein